MENNSISLDPDLYGVSTPIPGVSNLRQRMIEDPTLKEKILDCVFTPLAKEPEMLEVLYFGWSPVIGHGLRAPEKGIWTGAFGFSHHVSLTETPWGTKLDGGLCPEVRYGVLTPEPDYLKVHRLDGWTAVAFWDRSGDSRPGSNTAFLVRSHAAHVEDILKWARIQWPEVWARPGFPIR